MTATRPIIEALGFFKTVDITTEPGSAPDKVIVDITVVEQSTGDYGITAGYDSASGILGELSITERNFLGRGQYIKASVGASQTGKSFDFTFTEPYFMGLKVSTGFDLYDHITDQTATSYYGLQSIGGQVRAGMPITDAISANAFLGYEQDTYSTSYNFSTGWIQPLLRRLRRAKRTVTAGREWHGPQQGVHRLQSELRHPRRPEASDRPASTPR